GEGDVRPRQPLPRQPEHQARVVGDAGGVSRPTGDIESEVAPGQVLRNPGVLGIGLGSLLSDAGHEMATAALPGFLRSLGAPAAALGVIEGVADAALSASKVAGGVVADRPGVERKALTAGGYRSEERRVGK